MKISVNSIRYVNQQYGSAGNPNANGMPDLIEKVGAQLGAVEEVIDIGSKYEGVVVARVVSCEKHPNADKLNVCLVDDGGVTAGVTRDDDGLAQVVCGAPNVRAGLTVAWLPPGSTVPESVGKDPFVLGARELRGIVSNGMLASPRELALGDSHEGILELAQDNDETFKPGLPFAEAINVTGDVVLDIENKMFTHRPDCFGFMGIAREIEGIYHRPYKSPAWYRPDVAVPAVETEPLPIAVQNELPELVKRFCLVSMRDVQVGPSPVWLQVELLKVGQRPINNIVDYTNYFMLLTGQPLHAYDYDKVRALSSGDVATLTVRYPHAGETINLLNGKTIEPRAEAIMIAADKALIGVGGVMGGADTEVDETTKHIILEAANFDMYSIRRTSMAHGLFTEAVTRFNKGQSPLQNRAVIAKIVDEIRQFAGGKVASELIDDNQLPPEVLQRNTLYAPVVVTDRFINERLGLTLMPEQMAALLTNVEFAVSLKDGEYENVLTVTAPFWRTDIEIAEDVVEEIGRLYGFDQLPLVLPHRDLAPAVKDPLVEVKSRIRAALSQAGANELLTYSFVHGNMLQKAGQDAAQAYKVSNALSPDLQYYRLSITPSLLDKVHANIKAGYDEFALFEIGKSHLKGRLEDDAVVPKEYNNVALVVAAADKRQKAGAPFYAAKQYVQNLAATLGTTLRFEPLTEAPTKQPGQPYDFRRSAYIFLGDATIPLGMVGEFKPSVSRSFKLPAFTAGFEIGVVPELQGSDTNRYHVLPKYPKVAQDICLRVPATVHYAQLYQLADKTIGDTVATDIRYAITPVDIYQPADNAEVKHVTLRVSIASFDKTLRDAEVTSLLDKVGTVAAQQFQAERV